MVINDILSWLAAHHAHLWLALALVLNVALRLRTEAEWVTWAQTTRLGAAVLGFVHVLRLDPVALIKLGAAVVNAKAAAEAAGVSALSPALQPTGIPPGGSGGSEGAGGGSAT